MSVVDDSLEWRSVMEALRDVKVEERAILGNGSVIAYTDGACIKNPGGPAGWSAILLSAADVTNNQARQDAKRLERYGYIPKSPTTTNNRAEISAVLAALSMAPRDQPLTIHSDSEYTIKVAQGVYKMKANPDLWSLYQALVKHRQTPPLFQWVRGHAGHDLNELADELAGLGAWNNDYEAYSRWQESNAPEAHNAPASPELAALRQQVQKLKALFDSLDSNDARVRPNEREFINDMAKRLQKNNFAPSEKQANWIKVLAGKFKV
ncbi:MAG TPA: ribonuclease H [Ktedonobacteraceae bacterium]|nr:ribonuclease H [Ktedonobacteraceae bacterium]